MAIDSTGGRLSPENIKDVLLRAELYREIRAAQTKDLEKNWFTYEIQPSETLMPDRLPSVQHGYAEMGDHDRRSP